MSETNDTSRDSRSFLDNVMVAAPCNVSWESMEGDERVRFCGGCKLNVYNTSFMTEKEIEVLLAADGKRPCIRLFRRIDGTIITENCPVGMRKIRDACRKVSGLAALCWAFVFSSVAAWAQQNTTDQLLKGSVSNQVSSAADLNALELYNKAKSATKDETGDDADRYFKLAMEAVSTENHDPKFTERISLDYYRYLKSKRRDAEADAVLARLRSLKNTTKEKIMRMKSPGLGAPVGMAIGGISGGTGKFVKLQKR